MIKILHIIPNLKKGGAERLVIDICSSLSIKNNVEVKLVYLNNEVEYDLSELNFKAEFIPSKIELSVKKRNFYEIELLRKYIQTFKPNIIHTHLFEAELISRSIHYPHAKWFSHCHDNMIQFLPLTLKTLLSKSSFTNFFEKKYLFKKYKENGGTHFIAISKHTESFFRKSQFIFPITLLNNGINLNRFKRSAEFHKETNSKIKIVNIGSFFPKKNQSLLLDIIVMLNLKGFQTETYFLGDGPTKKTVEKKANELGISNQCHFLGNVDNVEEYLWQADFYVHTALYEPFGLVLLEAMAAECTVICLNGGGNSDIITNKFNGFIFQEQDSELFANALIHLKQNIEIKNQISENALTFIKQYDINLYTEKLLDIYLQKNNNG